MTAAATIGTLADQLAEVLLRGDPFRGIVHVDPRLRRRGTGLVAGVPAGVARSARRHHRPLRRVRGGLRGHRPPRPAGDRPRHGGSRAGLGRLPGSRIQRHDLPARRPVAGAPDRLAHERDRRGERHRLPGQVQADPGLSRPARGEAADRRAGWAAARRPARQRRHQAAAGSPVAPGAGPDARSPATRGLGWGSSVAGRRRARRPRSGPPGHRPLRRPARRATASITAARASRPALRTRRRGRLRVLRPERHDAPVRPRRAPPPGPGGPGGNRGADRRARPPDAGHRRRQTTSWSGSARTPR